MDRNCRYRQHQAGSPTPADSPPYAIGKKIGWALAPNRNWAQNGFAWLMIRAGRYTTPRLKSDVVWRNCTIRRVLSAIVGPVFFFLISTPGEDCRKSASKAVKYRCPHGWCSILNFTLCMWSSGDMSRVGRCNSQEERKQKAVESDTWHEQLTKSFPVSTTITLAGPTQQIDVNDRNDWRYYVMTAADIKNKMIKTQCPTAPRTP